MAIEAAERLWSAQEYLEWESAQPYKYELINNLVYAMTGVYPTHNDINFDLAFALMSRLEHKQCHVYGMDIQMQVDPSSTYTYPDLIVACGEARFRYDVSPPRLENPTLIFEILSASTEARDRNQKREQYLQIPSLLGYFLVSQDKPLIEAYLRSGDDWRFTECAGLEATLKIPLPDCEIPLREVYRRVRFTGS